MSARSGIAGRLVLLGLLGAIAGPLLLSRIAFWDHLRRYGTPGEFWGDLVIAPLGLLSGPLSALWLARLAPTANPRIPGLPLKGRWVSYLLRVLAFVAIHVAVYALAILALNSR